MQKAGATKSRIDVLDYLRGFFILVIVVDHLNRWPSAFVWITGQGSLWVSAAEGFFIISGLLVGYIRGRKELSTPFKQIAKTLVKRAGMLYIWSVVLTITFVLLIWWSGVNREIVPPVPTESTPWWTILSSILTQQYVFDWIYFLRLYWMMLLVSPLAIWLLRKNKAWLLAIISVTLWSLNLQVNAEAFFQWQLLFFIPAIAGFYLDDIRSRVTSLSASHRNTLGASLIVVTIVTMAVSALWVNGHNPNGIVYSSLSSLEKSVTYHPIDAWFTNNPMAAGRILLSFLWFCGLFALFQYALPFIKRWLGWLLLVYGSRSLTAYAIHGFVLIAMQLFIPQSTWFFVNTFMGVVAVLGVWGLVELKVVQRVFPR